MKIERGLYTYNFSCLLMEKIPHSVEGQFGSVRYRVDANLDIPWAFDLTSQRAFTVIRREDLNMFPELTFPREVEEMQTFGCFCKSDPLIIKVRLPRGGFALGEKIPVSVELYNNSATNVAYTEIALKKVEQFNSESPYKETKECMEDIEVKRGRGASSNTSVSFEDWFEVPRDLAISNYRYCSVFQISYILMVTAVTEGWNTSPEIHIPLTIGSIGLHGSGFQQVAPVSASTVEQRNRLNSL